MELNRFSSKMQDTVLGENMNPGFKSWYTDGDNKYFIGNRDVRTEAYIGMDLSPRASWPDDNIFWKSTTYPFFLYKHANNYYSGENYYDKIVSLYTGEDNNISSIMYYLNNQFIDKEGTATRLMKTFYGDTYISVRDNGLFLNGDCFLTRYFFRMTYNGAVFAITDSEASDVSRGPYDHGDMVSFVVMSDINTCARGIDKIGFYPNWARDVRNDQPLTPENYVLNYARFGGGINRTLGEDRIYDFGYSQMQHLLPIPGVDMSYHDHTQSYPTRVRYTDPHVSGAYIDGWRTMMYNSKQDFPSELGDALSIIGYMNSMITVHENAIIQLNIDVKVQQPDSMSGTEVLLGTGPIIDKNFRKLADYGSQHPVVQTGFNGVYGYDFKRGIIWGITIKTNNASMYLAAESLSDGLISSDLAYRKGLVDTVFSSPDFFYDPRSWDMLGIIRGGISMGFDEKNKEVYVTLMAREWMVSRINEDGHLTIPEVDVNRINWPGYITVHTETGFENIEILNVGDGYLIIDGIINDFTPVLVELGFTYVYSELMKSIYQRSITPSLYAYVNDVLVHYNRLFDSGSGKVWFNDNEASMCQFYGFNDGFEIGVVINDSKEGMDKYPKMASSCVVPSDSIPFDKLELRTEFQYGEFYPFFDENRFWSLPEYNENTWKMDLPVQSSVAKEGYEPDSQMRGTWIEMIFKYKGVAKKYVGGIISKYIISFN